MSRIWLIAIPGFAALSFAAIMFYLVIQIDQTRKQLQADGIQEFNFVQQVDQNYDTLAQSIADYLATLESPASSSLRDAYILRYDVLYASIKSVGGGWQGQLKDLASTQGFLADSNAFLDRYEPLMTPDIVANSAELYQMKSEARLLAYRVYEIGLAMFESKSTLRDNISARMNNLYEAFWIVALSFLLASLITMAFLFTLSRRTEILTADAQNARTKLTTALNELTTGDNERRAQNRFMAAASHDLRQPLHAMGMYLSALKRHVPSEKGLSILANINRSTEALNELLNSMLDLSKLDAGVVEVNYEVLDLNTVFDLLQQSFQPIANQQDLVLDIQPTHIHVYSDRALLGRILGNLVGNALKYTVQGRVTLSARMVGNNAIISVTDTGPGIPLEEQEAVFNEYYQLQNTERDRSKGLGLGLSIVKRLTHLLNVSLTIDSDTGKGTTVNVQMRISEPTNDKPPLKTPPTAQIAHKTANEQAHVDRLNSARSLAQGTDAPITFLSGLSILVIDDEREVREGTYTLLKQQECDVVVADSAQQACEYLVANEWLPDLIIADYRLRDDITGAQAIEIIREEINMDVPAMIITGDTSPERLREAKTSGFLLLHKPVNANELIASILDLVSAEGEAQ